MPNQPAKHFLPDQLTATNGATGTFASPESITVTKGLVTNVRAGTPGGGSGGGVTPVAPVAPGLIVADDTNTYPDTSFLQFNQGALSSTEGGNVEYDLPTATTALAGISILATPSSDTTAGHAVQASDARLSDSRTPTGPAGGDLAGTYPNPTYGSIVSTTKGGLGQNFSASATGGIPYLSAIGVFSIRTVGSNGDVLTLAAGIPTWASPASGITQLTGDVTAGPGIGSQVATLATVTVPKGGTGLTSTTAYGVLIGGTTSTAALQSVAVGTPGQVLTSNGAGAAPTMQTWATGLPAASAAGKMVYDNGSAYVATSAGADKQTIRYNGTVPTPNSTMTNDGNGIVINAGATGTAPLTLNGIAAQTANFIDIIDSGSTNRFKVASTGFTTVTSSATNAALTIQAASGALLRGQTATAPVNGTLLTVYQGAGITTGSTFAAGFDIRGVAKETWNSTSALTDLQFGTCNTGTVTFATRLVITGGGTIDCGPSAVATSSTTGHLHWPTCAGIPTGVPEKGNGSVIYDSTNNKPYLYIGGNWKQFSILP